MPDRSRELNSWKQIAAHLGVNVRTAQKYERERGLPVRRLPGGHGRVAIDVSTLDRWKHTPPTLPTEGTMFRWPVDRDMIAEVRFTGTTLTPGHIHRLIEYLTLVKTALE
jgi:hypothetical protein